MLKVEKINVNVFSSLGVITPVVTVVTVIVKL